MSMVDIYNTPGVTVETGKDMVTRVKVSDRYGDFECAYWRVDNVKEGNDAWRYSIPFDAGQSRRGHWSHPSEQGCEIMIGKFLVETGVIAIPEDNSHLDPKDRDIVADIEIAYALRYNGKPRVGDFVRMPDGAMHRICATHEYGAQTCPGGSFSTGRGGYVSYSGGLNSSKLYERFKDAKDTKRGRFWIFHHGLPGAGRGVDIYLDCLVFDLVDFQLTEDQAKAHPAAQRFAEFWGEDSTTHRRKVDELMRGEG